MKVVSPARMAEIDRITIESHGVAAADLMEAAGRALADHTLREQPDASAFVVLCGKGNNGGDGYVAARYLSQMEATVAILRVDDQPLNPVCAGMRAMLPDTVSEYQLSEVKDLARWLAQFDVVVDALLGTGFRAPAEGAMADVIRAVNAARLFVVSADIPSGLDGDSGSADPAVKAAVTVTFGRPKRGFFTRSGLAHVGRIVCEPLAFPGALFEDAREEVQTLQEAAALLPPRAFDGNKGTFGLVAIAAGSAPMPGAAVLCAQGAVRSGVGLVRLQVPASVRPPAVSAVPEALHPLPPAAWETEPAPMDDAAMSAFLQRTEAVVCGPGIGQSDRTRDFLYQLIERATMPLVLDADALNLLASDPEARGWLDERSVLTPHPGELARLLDTTASAVQEDRWGSARTAADRFGCVVVLKGAGTMVSAPGKPVVHVPTGNSGLARGGSGDILAGLIGGLLAQGLAPFDAARLGVWVHGMAADIVCRTRSARGITLHEVLEAIPLAFRELEAASGTPS